MEDRRISDELKRYGYVFSLRKNVILYIMASLISFLMGRIFRLNMVCQIILIIAVVIMLPFFIRNSLINRDNQQRFSDLNIYMEQFLYSFQKTGKIITTLNDVLILFEDGTMKDTIKKAIDHIENTYNESDVERNGLKIIEREYPCSGLKNIHSFALEVEKNGGEYQESTLLLLESRRLWADRNYKLLTEKKHQRTRIILSILITLLLCTMIYFLSYRMKIDVAANPLSQGVTLFVLISDLFIFYISDKKMSADDAIRDESDQKGIKDAEERIEKYDEKKLFQGIAKKSAIKRVTRQLEIDFPKWLMQVSLLLQTENVPVAVIKSYSDAPASLKLPLKKFIYDLKKDPSGIRPYISFLKEYTLPEVRSSMKMLYSLSEGAGGKASSQIPEIIRRNQTMMERAAELKNENALAGMYALFLAPQITGGIKLTVDMLLLFVVYMVKMGNSVKM